MLYFPIRTMRSKEKKKVSTVPAKFLYKYLLRYKAIFFPALLALMLTAGLSLAFPYYLGSLIGTPAEALKGNADFTVVEESLNKTIFILVGILTLQAVIAFFRVQGFIKAGESALNDIRKDVFSHLVRLPIEFFHKQRAGEISGRIAGDLEVLRETLMTTVPQFARQVVILIGGLIFLFITSVKLSLFMLGLIPVVVLAVAILGKSIRNFSRSAQDALSDSNVVVEESVTGIHELKAYTNEEYEVTRYESALNEFKNVAFKGAKARAAFVSFIIFALFGSISIVAWFGAGMLGNGEITSKEFTQFILFSVFVGASLGSIPEIFSQLNKAEGATERVREILGENVEEELSSEALTLAGQVELKNLNFAYPSAPEREILKNLSLKVQPGEKVAIVGSSGAGKSTLFQLLLGFYSTAEGQLLFDGKDANTLSLQARRKEIAIVPQDVLLFGGSIEENILYGDPSATEKAVRVAAEKANAVEFIEQLTEKYETLVGHRGVKLSGGQRQRIAIARAILADPKILLLDEATSALDSENEKLVQNALEELMKGRTSFIIAHRLSTIKTCDRIFVLEAGQIVESGSHDELMQLEGRYKHLAETQLLT